MFKFFILIACSAIIAGCSQQRYTELRVDTARYIDKKLGNITRPKISDLHAEMSQDVPNPENRYISFNRFLKTDSKEGQVLFNLRFRQRELPSVINAAFRKEKIEVLDVTMEFDLKGHIPVYRVILRPRNFSVDRLKTFPKTFILKQKGSSYTYSAKLPNNISLNNGRIKTDWIYCLKCISNNSKINELAVNEQLDILNQNLKAYKFKHTITSILFESKNTVDYSATGKKAITERDLMAKRLSNFRAKADAEHKLKLSKAATANKKYIELTNKIDKLTLINHLKQKCSQDFNTNTYYREIYRAKRDIPTNERYISCNSKALESYDQDNISKIEALSLQESNLWKSTYNLKRYNLVSTESALKRTENNLEDAQDWINNIEKKLIAFEEQQEREQARKASSALRTQLLLNSIQSQMNNFNNNIKKQNQAIISNALKLQNSRKTSSRTSTTRKTTTSAASLRAKIAADALKRKQSQEATAKRLAAAKLMKKKAQEATTKRLAAEALTKKKAQEATAKRLAAEALTKKKAQEATAKQLAEAAKPKKLGLVLTWQNKHGIWFACGPVQCIQVGEETETKAMGYTYNKRRHLIRQITGLGKCRAYEVYQGQESYDFSIERVKRLSNCY